MLNIIQPVMRAGTVAEFTLVNSLELTTDEEHLPMYLYLKIYSRFFLSLLPSALYANTRPKGSVEVSCPSAAYVS